MKLYVRCVILLIASITLAGCKTTGQPHKLGGGLSQSGTPVSHIQNFGSDFDNHQVEPKLPRWAVAPSKTKKSSSQPLRRRSIRQMAHRLAPPNVNVSTLSHMVSKRRQANIGCIPEDLSMILNTVAWHYGRRVHIQSGYRSKRHNRQIGGAKGSYHIHCKAVDIQVSGVNKYELARFLKTLPGRGGVGTYCSKSTVHIDVGPKRAWHYGCRKRFRSSFASK